MAIFGWFLLKYAAAGSTPREGSPGLVRTPYITEPNLTLNKELIAMQKYAFAATIVLGLLVAGPTFADDRPVTGQVQIAADHDHDHAAMAPKGAMGKGVVNSVDVAAHKVNVSHEPIPSLKWPAMKMDFAVAPSVDLKSVQAGSQVEFVVGTNKEGLPEIQSIKPAKK